MRKASFFREQDGEAEEFTCPLEFVLQGCVCGYISILWEILTNLVESALEFTKKPGMGSGV